MPEFTGVNHIALTVRDLDVSTRFYCNLLGFMVVLDIGFGRVCIHRGSGFTIALLQPEGGDGVRFSRHRTGLDHLGLAAGSRQELVAWEERLQAADVPYSPIQDMPLGYHLNFTDPDGIALEFQAPNDVYTAALIDLRTATISDDAVRLLAMELIDTSRGA